MTETAAAAGTADTAVAGVAVARDYGSDASIITFLNTANAYEIEEAETAQQRLTNSQAKKFAQQLEQHHQELRSKVADLQKQLD